MMSTRGYVAATSLEANDITSPAYSPSIFSHIKSPKKRKAEEDLRRFSRLTENKRRRIEGFEKERIKAQERQREREEAEEAERIRYEAEQERERVEAENRSETAEALLELSTMVVSHVSSTMTEMTQSDLAAIEQAASEKDVLSQENARLKEENASLHKQILSLKKLILLQNL